MIQKKPLHGQNAQNDVIFADFDASRNFCARRINPASASCHHDSHNYIYIYIYYIYAYMVDRPVRALRAVELELEFRDTSPHARRSARPRQSPRLAHGHTALLRARRTDE